MTTPNPASSVPFSSLGWRAAGLLLIWCALAEPRPWTNWPLALGILTAAVLTSLRLRSRHRFRLNPWKLLQFIPWFLGQSWIGGTDVARRACSPSMPLRAAFIDLPLRAPDGPPRIAFIWVVNLLPGTAAVQLHESSLRVHVLDTEIHTRESLAEIERRICALFHLS